VLIAGEKAVGTIVDDVSMSQPQVSKRLRLLSEVGLVSCRAEGRRRLYRLQPENLRPVHDWMAKYEQATNAAPGTPRHADLLHAEQHPGHVGGPAPVQGIEPICGST
jgi:DNA-binding transcriptional ArsR family regulator